MRVGWGTVDPALGVLHGCAHPTVGGGERIERESLAGGSLFHLFAELDSAEAESQGLIPACGGADP